uniref:RFX-type winged-helix domain-containing protein n=1 Tax=Mesocestoides corti TaxID=53468 RepID=A0A5K3ERA4_MESCO
MQAHGEQEAANIYGHLLPNFEKAVTPDSRSRIDALLREFSSFKDTEKLLFCLLLPTEPSGICSSSLADDEISANGFEINSLGVGLFSGSGCSSLHLSNQVEQSQAYTWIMSHLEEDASTCLRKDEVYEDYRLYCEKHNQKTLNTADFGKVMKRAFPNVKPRRLGQRGQSRYCYGGMRKKLEVQPPSLPDLTAELSAPTLSTNFRSASSSVSSTDDHRSSLRGEASSWFSEEVRGVLGVTGPVLADVANVLLEYAQNVFGTTFTSLTKLAEHLVANRYVSTRSRHSFALIAHISNNPSNSTPVTGSSSLSNMLLSPSSAAAGAFAEALQKGVYGQAHRQSLDCYPNSSDASGIGLKLSNSAHSSPIISGKEDVKKEVVDQDLSCVELPSVRNTRTPTVRVSSAGATAAASSLSQTPPTTASQVAGGSLFPYRSPLCTNNYDNSRAERSPNVTASTPAVTSAYHISPSAHYPFTLSQFSTTSASILQNPAGKPLGSTYTGISAYLQPPQPYAHCSSTDHRRMRYLLSLSFISTMLPFSMHS